MLWTEFQFIVGIQVIIHIKGVVGTHADDIVRLSILVKLGHDVLVVDTGDKRLLLVVVVVHTKDAVHCEVLQWLVDELYLGVHVILTVFAHHGVYQ